jgi:hypothetical protein
LTIVEVKPKDPTKGRPFGKKKDEDFIEEFHEFTKKNYEKLPSNN